MKSPPFFFLRGGGRREWGWGGGVGGGGILGPLLPKILFDLAEILTRASLPIRQTQCLKNPSKY